MWVWGLSCQELVLLRCGAAARPRPSPLSFVHHSLPACPPARPPCRDLEHLDKSTKSSPPYCRRSNRHVRPTPGWGGGADARGDRSALAQRLSLVRPSLAPLRNRILHTSPPGPAAGGVGGAGWRARHADARRRQPGPRQPTAGRACASPPRGSARAQRGRGGARCGRGARGGGARGQTGGGGRRRQRRRGRRRGCAAGGREPSVSAPPRRRQHALQAQPDGRGGEDRAAAAGQAW